jgi:hypothetical protein
MREVIWMLSRVTAAFCVGFATLPLCTLLIPDAPERLVVGAMVAGFSLPIGVLIHMDRHRRTRQAAQDQLMARRQDGLLVRVLGVEARGRTDYEVVVEPPAGELPLNVRLGKELPLLPDLATGDDTFDQAVRVKGDPIEVLSLLGAEARAALVELLEDHPGATLEDGGLRVRLGMRSTREEIVQVGERLARVVALLRSKEASVDRLVQITRCDPSSDVCQQALRTLLREASDAPPVRELAAELVEGEELSLAVLAAESLGLDDRVAELRANIAGQRGQLAVMEAPGGELSPEGSAGAVSRVGSVKG